MGVGIDVDLSANPWRIAYNGSSGTALPVVVWPNGQPFLPRRMLWVSDGAAQGDKVVLKNAASTAKEIVEFIATGADYTPPQEWKSDSKELFNGLQVTTFSSGTLYIYV